MIRSTLIASAVALIASGALASQDTPIPAPSYSFDVTKTVDMATTHESLSYSKDAFGIGGSVASGVAGHNTIERGSAAVVGKNGLSSSFSAADSGSAAVAGAGTALVAGAGTALFGESAGLVVGGVGAGSLSGGFDEKTAAGHTIAGNTSIGNADGAAFAVEGGTVEAGYKANSYLFGDHVREHQAADYSTVDTTFSADETFSLDVDVSKSGLLFSR